MNHIFPFSAVAEKRVDFAYNAASEFSTITRYKDTDGGSANLVAESTFGYDGMGRINDLVHKKDTTTFADYGWSYDAGSRVTQLSYSFLVGGSGNTNYSYDNTDQLTQADFASTPDEKAHPGCVFRRALSHGRGWPYSLAA